MKWLEQIEFPGDLRRIAKESLPEVCKEVRETIVDVVSEKGGHFASNLGSVELTVALHYVFETPEDKLVWDVGHQAYGHKILTGRRQQFSTIRHYQGLSGFTSREESEYDHFGAGHASTSISAALGIAEALRHQGKPNFAVAIIGDGSLSGGLAYEALNNAGHIPARNLVVVLNDNDMSIDPNVGAVNKFINQAVTHPGYNRLRKEIKHGLDSLHERGFDLTSVVSRLRKSVKNFFSPGMLFECFGFRYIGPIDGHDVEALRETFAFIKQEGIEEGPYLVHAITKKGKGYKLAEEDSLKYHGVNPFNSKEGIKPSSVKKLNFQDVFGSTLIRIGKENSKLVAITAAMPSGTGVRSFQKEFPNRTYDVGIAEGHAVCFAAGMATEGYRPVVAIYSTFLQRAYDQIIHDVALQKLPVIFAMDRAGLVGADGATHQGAFDISYLRCIPNMVVMAPKDENELQHMIKTAVEYEAGPIAFRYPRGEVVGVKLDAELRTIPIGKGEVAFSTSDEPDVLLIGIGCSVQECLGVARQLEQEGYNSAVINARFVKPLDESLLQTWISKSKLIVTVEENAQIGGFGSAVLELMAQKELKKPALTLGLPDHFIDHASPKIQRELVGLESEAIFLKILGRLNSLRTVPDRKNPVSKQKPVSQPSRLA